MLEAPAQDRLLVLDDDPAIGCTIEVIAETVGIAARCCTDAPSFFELLDSWQPTIIALDLVMPDMDGVQVIGQLAARGCRARLIISSGLDDRVLDAARRSAVQHGLNIEGVLPKPFSPSQLRTLLGTRSTTEASLRRPEAGPAGAGAVAGAIGPEELRRALDHDELSVVYQPKVACADGRLAGLEVLARWRSPQRGNVSPELFIAAAEAHGLIDALTERVLDLALPWFGRAFPHSSALGHVRLSVNLSPHSLRNVALVDDLTTQCARHGIPPTRLVLELTETSAMEDPVASLDMLTRFRMKGFVLSIDDFGTGYSSMLQLVRLPFSEIKIDKSFVMTATPYAESAAVVRSIVGLARSLGMRCTAEGVEDAQTLVTLRELGCDEAQGFHIGRPMPGDDVPGWMQTAGVG